MPSLPNDEMSQESALNTQKPDDGGSAVATNVSNDSHETGVKDNNANKEDLSKPGEQTNPATSRNPDQTRQENVDEESSLILNPDKYENNQKSTSSTNTNTNLLVNTIKNCFQCQPLTPEQQSIFNVIVAIVVIVVLSGAFVALGVAISALVNTHKNSRQYLMCELNRDKLSTQGETVTLPWNILRDQKYGNIEVIKDTVIVVPEDGVYDIHVTLHEEIPKETKLNVMTFTFLRENVGIKQYKRVIYNASIDLPMTMDFSLRRLLQANEKIRIERNLAKYNRIKQPSGTLTITKIS